MTQCLQIISSALFWKKKNKKNNTFGTYCAFIFKATEKISKEVLQNTTQLSEVVRRKEESVKGCFHSQTDVEKVQKMEVQLNFPKSKAFNRLVKAL